MDVADVRARIGYNYIDFYQILPYLIRNLCGTRYEVGNAVFLDWSGWSTGLTISPWFDYVNADWTSKIGVTWEVRTYDIIFTTHSPQV